MYSQERMAALMDVSLETMKAGLEETEATLDVFKGRLNKMDITELEATQETES
jgi:hypothetical protein